MLTLVEYFLLLYRSLLPTAVWYRFFLNKEYGSLFSSLTTGLYLTFKLTSVVEQVWYTLLNASFWYLLYWSWKCSSSWTFQLDRTNYISTKNMYLLWYFQLSDFRFNHFLLHWRHYHVKKYIMGLMQRLNRWTLDHFNLLYLRLNVVVYHSLFQYFIS